MFHILLWADVSNNCHNSIPVLYSVFHACRNVERIHMADGNVEYEHYDDVPDHTFMYGMVGCVLGLIAGLFLSIITVIAIIAWIAL